MNIRFTFSRLASVIMALVPLTTARGESPALEGTTAKEFAVGKPGSGAPLPLGQINLTTEQTVKPGRKTYFRSTNDSTSTVVRVQRALKQRGLYAGPIDGSAGTATRAAVRNFKKENGLPLTTTIDKALLSALSL